MQVQSYLFFEGRCEDAMAFYGKVLGATVTMLMRYRDAPPQPADMPAPEGCAGPVDPDKVMHCSFRIGETELMASDGMCSGKPNFAGVSQSLTVGSTAEAERIAAALAEGGSVQMPPSETFFAHRFAMVQDRFGLSWMILHPKAMDASRAA